MIEPGTGEWANPNEVAKFVSGEWLSTFLLFRLSKWCPLLGGRRGIVVDVCFKYKAFPVKSETNLLIIVYSCGGCIGRFKENCAL